MQENFVHLRNHTEYSLCIGAIKLKQLSKTCIENEMTAVAMTDTGNLFGSLEFSCEMQKSSIQPIIGVEILFDYNEFLEEEKKYGKTNIEIEKNFFKLLLIAQNDIGYLNLMSIVSDSFLERKSSLAPHTSLQKIKDNSEGIIVLSGGHEGGIGQAILNGRGDKANLITETFKGIFGDKFYIEIMRHGLPDQITTEPEFIKIAYEQNIPIVATNDCYFLKKEMFDAQDALSCIAEGRYVVEEDRPKTTPEHFFKSSQEMKEIFRDLPEAIENTINIKNRISTMAYERKPTLPHFSLPKGITEAEELRRLSYIGLKERMEEKFVIENITSEEERNKINKLYLERLKEELDIIINMDFPGYFLIVSDFIIWSKENDIPVGPGRGSGAGSVCAWVLQITDLDPINFSLFFERFLNPERVSMPDFDIDFCQKGRGKVIEYVQKKYGSDMVAQIITFGKLQAKAVIKDVGRVFQIPYGEVDKISKMIPFNAGSLEEAIESDDDLKEKSKSDPIISKLFEIGLQLEGLNRHSSIHAAGVVIGDKPLKQICPLYFDDNAEMPVVQYQMKYAEKVGLVKFDFLGLKTLTTIKDAIGFIKRRGVEIDIAKIPLTDEKVYKMLQTGDAIGVFQIESSGMRSLLKQIKPDNIEDIIALVALYRPGPMENIPTFIKRKHGLEEVDYPHPDIERILKDTYGIIVYQEQVMEIAKVLAGYSLGGADMLRRAMGKKIKEEMDAQREIFVSGCQNNSINEKKADEIFDLLAKFANYGFNKAHAAAYGVISYQTGFLKAHYPTEFLTATINMDIHDSDKISIYLQDAKAHGIDILEPDVNSSMGFFDVKIENDIPKIRFGLAGIKGVGMNVADAVMAERDKNGIFTDIFDFASRMSSKVINKKTIEALAKAGAFDKIHSNRKQIHDSCDTLSNYCARQEEDRNDNQMNLFASLSDQQDIKPALSMVDDWQGADRYQKEFEAFGFFLKDHPLSVIENDLSSRGVTFLNEIDESYIENGDKIRIAGVVIATKIKSGPKGRYAFISISDATNNLECSIFSNDLINDKKDLIEEVKHNSLMFECSIKKDEGGTRILINDMYPLRDFIRVIVPGSVQKIIRRENKYKSNKLNDYGAKNDIIMQSREKIIKEEIKNVLELFIKINDKRYLQDFKEIISSGEKNNRETKIILEISGNKIDLGGGFYITSKEIEKLNSKDGLKDFKVKYI